MDGRYHREILERALGARVSRRALRAIFRANIGQDNWIEIFQHPERHFDNNLIAEGLAYIEQNREAAAKAQSPSEAWAAFGRLTHAAQDFYAHSNYVRQWAEQFDWAAPPAAIDGLDPTLLKHPRLMTCRTYLPFEALYYLPLPGMKALVRRFLPKDSHAWMNLDNPRTGPLFPFAIEAAVQRTAAEFERTLAAIGEEGGEAAVRAFCDNHR
jgi:hypothetical protein